MLTALIATHLAAATLLPSNPEPAFQVKVSRRMVIQLPVGPAGWVVLGGVSGATAFAIAGSELELAANRRVDGVGLLVGSLVGAAIGYTLGYFARHGWVSAKYAVLALTVLAAGGLGGEAYRFADGFSSGRYQVRLFSSGLLRTY